jgi:paired amphipathic helix protein Sin3a
MWKEIDSKNFYKALDHQGINFKQNDKKNITAKHFVTDIQNMKKHQLRKWEWKGTRAFAHGSVGHQLEYSFKNTAVLRDTLKLVFLFLERSPAHYSPHERRGVEKFLRAFVPLLCMTTEAEFKTSGASGPSDGGVVPQDDSAHDRDTAEGSRSGGRRSTGSGHGGLVGQSGGIPANDLRKKLLKTAQEKAYKKESRAASFGVSRAASPSSAGHRSPRISRVDDELLEPQDVWIKEAAPKSSSSSSTENFISVPPDKDRPFFANTTFYTLLRLLEVSYF